LFVCKPWSLISREEHRLRVLENDQAKKDEMGKACSTNGKRNVYMMVGEEKDYYEDLHVGGRIILKMDHRSGW
jgi:hypothetical protein